MGLKPISLKPASEWSWSSADTAVCVGSFQPGNSTFRYKPKQKDLQTKDRLLALQADILKKIAGGSWSLPKPGDMLGSSRRNSKIFYLVMTEPSVQNYRGWVFVYFDSMIFRNKTCRSDKRNRIPLVKLYENFFVLPTNSTDMVVPPIPA